MANRQLNMISIPRFLWGVALAAAMGLLVSSCDTPFLGSAGTKMKEAVMGKPIPEPDLQEHPRLVIPPPNAPLPAPGQAAQAGAQR
jgi:hypothetical protein